MKKNEGTTQEIPMGLRCLSVSEWMIIQGGCRNCQWKHCSKISREKSNSQKNIICIRLMQTFPVVAVLNGF